MSRFSINSEGGVRLGMFFYLEWWWNYIEIRSGGRFIVDLGFRKQSAFGWGAINLCPAAAPAASAVKFPNLLFFIFNFIEFEGFQQILRVV